MKATGLITIQPKGIQGPVRVWTSGHNLRACTRLMTPDGQYQTVRVKVDMRPLVSAMARWHERQHGPLPPQDKATIGRFMAGESVFSRTPIVSGECGPVRVGRGFSPHIDVVGVEKVSGCMGATLEEDEFGRRYRLNIGAASNAAPKPVDYACEVVLDNFGRVKPDVRKMRHGKSPRTYLQHLKRMERTRPDGGVETVNAFVTVGTWDPNRKRWVPLNSSPGTLAREHNRIGFLKNVTRPVKKAGTASLNPVKAAVDLHKQIPGAKSILAAANKVAKDKALIKLSRATKDVLRSDAAKGAVGTLAVAFPPVGVPAATAFASANLALSHMDRAEAAKRDLQRLAATRGKEAAAKALPALKPILAEGQKAARTIQAVQAAAQSGNPRAQKAMAIYKAVDGTRRYQQNLVKDRSPGLAQAMRVAQSLPVALKRYKLSQDGRVEFGSLFGCPCEDP